MSEIRTKYVPGFVKAEHSKPITADRLPRMLDGVETPENGSIVPEKVSLPIPKMYSLKEASELTNLSVDFLRHLCRSGKVGHIRAGNKIMINANALAEYLNNNMGDLE